MYIYIVCNIYKCIYIYMIVGAYAELRSYRTSILVGTAGRVVTRLLLLYGKSLTDMQVMQVTYAMVTLCMYVCMYICMYVYIYLSMYVCIKYALLFCTRIY